MLAKIMHDASAVIWSPGCCLEWNSVLSYCDILLSDEYVITRINQRVKVVLNVALFSSSLGKLVCINKGGNADIWSPLETLSCVSTKVPAPNSSTHTDIIQISQDAFDCAALQQRFFVRVFGNHIFFHVTTATTYSWPWGVANLHHGQDGCWVPAYWRTILRLWRAGLEQIRYECEGSQGSVWALSIAADSMVLHFHLCCLHVSVPGSHLVFIFYQNVSIFVGGEEPVASPLVW